jgi:UDP-N-acetyl-D-mannosaminuronic acid transferase (WecB/TagA/CpsF family)
MSTPKSEMLSHQAAGICQTSVIWHIGGGTIMCYAGTKRRPPAWIHTLGIEWIHRFYYERHTRKRYLIYGFGFVCYLAAAFVKSLVAPANQRPSTKRMQ